MFNVLGGKDGVSVEEIQARIIPFLKERGSIAELHRATGIPQSTIHNWKTRNLPSLPEAYKFCLAIGKSIEWLVTGREEQPVLMAAEPSSLYGSDSIIVQIENELRDQSDEIKKMVLGSVQGIVATAGKPKGGTGSAIKTG